MNADPHWQTEAIFIHHPRLREVQEVMERCRKWSADAQEPYCLLVIGPSGAGKSTLIAHYLKANPRTVTSASTVIPVLNATIPVPATMKTMATELLERLGDPMAQRGTLHQKTWRLQRLLKSCGVELIVLDEFQHFIDRDSDKVLRSVADWLKVLIDTTGIPVVLVGLPSSRVVLDSNEQLRRRFGTHERLDPFGWQGDQRGSFRIFLEKVDEKLPLPERSGLAAPEMAFRFFAASEGLIAPVMRIVRKATHLAIDAGMPRLELPLLERVYAEDLRRDDSPNPFAAALPVRAPRQAKPAQPALAPRLVGKGPVGEPSLTAS